MNLDNKDEKTVAEYAEKHGCSVAAARFRLSRTIGQPVVFDKSVARPIAEGPEHVEFKLPDEETPAE